MPAVEQSRHLATAIPGPKSSALIERKNSAVARGVGTTMPVYAARAAGGILEDIDGNRLIDLGSGIAVTTVGNGNPRVVEAVQRQVADFTHTCFMVTPYEEYLQVCEQLAARTPGEHEKRTALFNSGAEAVENAVKVARVTTGRQAVLAFEHGYHGRTNLTMALTAKNMPYKQGFGPFAGEVYRAPMAYPYRWPTGEKQCAQEAYDAFASMVTTQVGAENVAAVVVEPLVQGAAGKRVLDHGEAYQQDDQDQAAAERRLHDVVVEDAGDRHPRRGADEARPADRRRRPRTGPGRDPRCRSGSSSWRAGPSRSGRSDDRCGNRRRSRAPPARNPPVRPRT